MNILRLKRKNKLISFRRFILLIFSLIMTTFAWFAYSKVLDTELDLRIITWDIKLLVNGEEKTNPLDLRISELYPGMEPRIADVVIENNGETNATVAYEISEVSILGIPYNLVENEEDVVSDTDICIGRPASVLGKYTQNIINDPDRFPFKIELETVQEIAAGTSGYLKITVSWLEGNDVLDTKWGYDVAQYYNSDVAVHQPIRLTLKVNAIQKEEEINL